MTKQFMDVYDLHVVTTNMMIDDCLSSNADNKDLLAIHTSDDMADIFANGTMDSVGDFETEATRTIYQIVERETDNMIFATEDLKTLANKVRSLTKGLIHD